MIRLIVAALRRRATGDPDEGSLVMAIMGVVIMTGVVTIGLAALVNGEMQVRHDTTFAKALQGAESGLDQMVARVRQDPTAAGFTPMTGTDASGVTYSVTATGSNGHWTVDSTGTATTQKNTIHREVQEQVDSAGLFDVPLFGRDSLTLGQGSNPQGSAVDQYDSNVNSAVCSRSGTQSSMTSIDTRMCTPTTQQYGDAATDGALTMRGTDLSNVNHVYVDNASATGYANPDATGHCVGDSSTCASPKVVSQTSLLSYPNQQVCSNGVGAGAATFDGSYALAANAVYNFTDVTLNATAVANLANVSGSQLIICFSGNLNITSLGVAGLLPPVNSVPGTVLPTTYTPRPPATLVLIDTATSSGTSSVSFGYDVASVLTSTETALSAVVYAPNATCTANGHVDLYGALVCASVTGPAGVDVHYDTELKATQLQQTVRISNWREIH